MNTGKYVKYVRNNIDFTQAEFSLLFDVHVMTVSKWERGVVAPSPYQMAMLDRFRNTDNSEAKRILYSDGAISALIWLLT